MKKLFLSAVLLLLFLFPATTAFCDGIEMVITESECTDDGVVIKYSLINRRNFNRPNIGIGFKVTIGDRVAACKEIRTDIPRDSDGTEIMEVTLEVPCMDKETKVSSRVFRAGVSRYRVEEWFSDCP